MVCNQINSSNNKGQFRRHILDNFMNGFKICDVFLSKIFFLLQSYWLTEFFFTGQSTMQKYYGEVLVMLVNVQCLGVFFYLIFVEMDEGNPEFAQILYKFFIEFLIESMIKQHNLEIIFEFFLYFIWFFSNEYIARMCITVYKSMYKNHLRKNINK